jgi:hypothetical protein
LGFGAIRIYKTPAATSGIFIVVVHLPQNGKAPDSLSKGISNPQSAE